MANANSSFNRQRGRGFGLIPQNKQGPQKPPGPQQGFAAQLGQVGRRPAGPPQGGFAKTLKAPQPPPAAPKGFGSPPPPGPQLNTQQPPQVPPPPVPDAPIPQPPPPPTPQVPQAPQAQELDFGPSSGFGFGSQGGGTSLLDQAQRDLDAAFEFRRLNPSSRTAEVQLLIAQQRMQIAQRQANELKFQPQQFADIVNRSVSVSTAAAQGQARQLAARRGLAFSGIEQGVAGNVAAAGAAQQAAGVGELVASLQSAQQRERAAFDQGAFAFMNDFITRQDLGNLSEHSARLQNQFAADARREAQWIEALDIFTNAAGQGIGTAIALA